MLYETMKSTVTFEPELFKVTSTSLSLPLQASSAAETVGAKSTEGAPWCQAAPSFLFGPASTVPKLALQLQLLPLYSAFRTSPVLL